MKFSDYNHNVKVALVYSGLSSLSTGIWGYIVLSGYLKVITGSNTKVGIAEGIQGISQMLLAFPAGTLADRVGRDKVLRFATILGFVAILSIVFALYSGYFLDNNSISPYSFLCVGLALWGSFVGMTNTPLEALYADSTTDENRPKMNQLKFSLILATASSGPLTSIILFWFVGDTWTENELRIVFTCGVALLIPSLLTIYFFDDKKAISKRQKDESKLQEDDELTEPLLKDKEDSENHEEVAGPLQQEVQKSSAALYWVPRIVVAADVTAGFASGMTVKYFPLFFREECFMSPSEVCVLEFFTLLGMSTFSYQSRKIAKRLGRPNTVILFQLPGIFLLMSVYLMSLGYDVKVPGQVPLWRNKLLMGVIFVVRAGLMNCSRPLDRSILMEHVPSEERGYWNAFESVSKFGWSGSAVVGGLLMDNYGYGLTFFITASIQLIITLSYSFVKLYVKE